MHLKIPAHYDLQKSSLGIRLEFQLVLLLECSASRGMRQTFSCLSKLEGTTNLTRFLFGHVKYFLGFGGFFQI